MNRMAEIGLTGLTHILRGGVRVEKNRNLCYVNTVNWKRIVSPAYYQDIHIEENEMVNMCPLSCPKHCPSLGDFYGSKKAVRNCWSSTTCQIGKALDFAKHLIKKICMFYRSDILHDFSISRF